MGFSVPMALFDLLPVALFLISSVIFQRDFYKYGENARAFKHGMNRLVY